MVVKADAETVGGIAVRERPAESEPRVFIGYIRGDEELEGAFGDGEVSGIEHGVGVES